MDTARRVARRLLHPLAALLERRRRIVTGVFALLLVASIVLLVFDARVPYPRPSERPLFDGQGWSLLFRRPPSSAAEAPASAPVSGGAEAVGGGSVAPIPFAVMLYTVQPGDTISGVAERLGVSTDTISSLNRPGGRGVHSLVVGERIRIPNQDGIEVTVAGNLDSLCEKYGVEADEVLAVNGKTRADLKGSVALFFPGAHFRGYEALLANGMLVVNPMPWGWQSSSYGRRMDPFTGDPSRHQGIDIAAMAGTAVRSASDGSVTAVGYNDVLGNYVIVRQFNRSFVYGHLQEVLVRAGQRVVQGKTRIGLVGSTGRATGPHLHFEVRDSGVPVNPRYYMPGVR